MLAVLERWMRLFTIREERVILHRKFWLAQALQETLLVVIMVETNEHICLRITLNAVAKVAGRILRGVSYPWL